MSLWHHPLLITSLPHGCHPSSYQNPRRSIYVGLFSFTLSFSYLKQSLNYFFCMGEGVLVNWWRIVLYGGFARGGDLRALGRLSTIGVTKLYSNSTRILLTMYLRCQYSQYHTKHRRKQVQHSRSQALPENNEHHY